ncbi:sprT domain-containing protein [Putridiphycobacter roseus]|uniref:SprT domain-containing protein n=1 Tax=Putridiphycobacter roseus TaxID=2219161 RepID=A0A2W1N214_9FLAO|nr:SprT-like domain-containing protein [Putridiphycobacter roseus]PZE16991.1 sprT domain-containing protein [Putridiphycobacter roseus]
MQNKVVLYAAKLEKFLPQETTLYVAEMIVKYQVNFTISKKRKTKLGDYRYPSGGKGHRISVNGDLNPYAFLITTLHEFAHLKAFKDYGIAIKPHGLEWKQTFALLFQPVIDQDILPTDIYLAIRNYLQNAKASSCSDEALYRVLRRYDDKKAILVEHLTLGSKFMLNNLIFEKGKKLRKYYLCTNTQTNRQYRVLGMAEVQKHILDDK